MNNNVFNDLKDRGYIYQSTDFDHLKKLLNGPSPITFYLGIDPTADSLHIGHFFALMMFRRLQDAGHRGILVIGGATALVGDPSGKSDMRKMLTKDMVRFNLEEVKTLASRFIKMDGDNPAIVLDNADWFKGYDYVDFMREIGIHFNVNKMLAADAYENRLREGGLTFLEMGYMLMQAYDFIHLNREYGCVLQIGGSDQWGNIVAGVTLNRKLNFIEETAPETDRDICGLTCPLLLTRDGQKMGKTESGTLWVAREKTAPYEFYQYFYNVDDNDSEMLLSLFTDLPLDKIKNLVNTDILKAKRTMAYEITKLVHGKDEADGVLAAVDSLFSNKAMSDDAPRADLSKDMISEGINIIELLVASELLPSKSEARRNVEQGGISLNGEKVTSADKTVTEADINDGFALLKRGKKNFLKVYFN